MASSSCPSFLLVPMVGHAARKAMNTITLKKRQGVPETMIMNDLVGPRRWIGIGGLWGGACPFSIIVVYLWFLKRCKSHERPKVMHIRIHYTSTSYPCGQPSVRGVLPPYSPFYLCNVLGFRGVVINVVEIVGCLLFVCLLLFRV